MDTVGLRELRQEASEYVRRAEAGEAFDITVSGRLAARLVPASRRAWRRWDEVATIFSGTPDPGWEADASSLDEGMVDPWARER